MDIFFLTSAALFRSKPPKLFFADFFSVAYGWIRLSIIQIRNHAVIYFLSAFSCHKKQMIKEFFRDFVGKVDDFPWWMMSNFRSLTCKRRDMNSWKKHELLSQHILYFIFSWLHLITYICLSSLVLCWQFSFLIVCSLEIQW